MTDKTNDKGTPEKDYTTIDWRRIHVWKDSGDGFRRKVNSDTEKANVLLEWRDGRKLPPGYHFNGFRVLFSLEGMQNLSDDHVYVHAFTVNYHVDTDSGVMPCYDVREVVRIVESLQTDGKWPEKVQPWRQRVLWDNIEACAKGATATIGERVASKRVRF